MLSELYLQNIHFLSFISYEHYGIQMWWEENGFYIGLCSISQVVNLDLAEGTTMLLAIILNNIWHITQEQLIAINMSVSTTRQLINFSGEDDRKPGLISFWQIKI